MEAHFGDADTQNSSEFHIKSEQPTETQLQESPVTESQGHFSPKSEERDEGGKAEEVSESLVQPEAHIPNLMDPGKQFGGHPVEHYANPHFQHSPDEGTSTETSDKTGEFDSNNQNKESLQNDVKPEDENRSDTRSENHQEEKKHHQDSKQEETFPRKPEPVKEEISPSKELQMEHESSEKQDVAEDEPQISPLELRRETVEEPKLDEKHPYSFLQSQAEPPKEPELPPLEPVNKSEPAKTRSIKGAKHDGGKSWIGGWFDRSRLNKHVADLIYWRDARKSGIVFGSILAILLSLSVASFISVLSYASLAVLAITLSFRLYKNILQAVQKTSDGHPFKEYLEVDVTIPQEKVQEAADVAASRLNAALLELRRLFLVEDLVDSIKFGLILWGFTYLGSWFNGLTLVILGVVGLFTFPKVYETHQEKIDQHVDLVRGKVNELVEKIQAVLPIGKKQKSQ